ncbi:hypothetical protein FIBSPDRAFT_960582 [Athelia psychrophila]|uniref:Uncharacterized protein n=1 Tax=Athelia psychrophila TaxID=1759441 RepID=A0A166C908_9AGAM|nr:hypothetical protein FIBSPDRAFT_960582 [Fibularhizoctonia sp. CBS 109695]
MRISTVAKEFAPEEDAAAAADDDDEPVYYSYMGIDDHSMITLPGPAMDTSPDIPLPSPPTLPPVPPALTPQFLPPLNYSSVLDQVYDPPTPITWLEGLQSLELVVYNRYGFTWHDRPTPYDRMATLGHSLPPECWETTRKIVCDLASKWNPIVKDLENPFSDFVQCFLNETISVPPSLWGLSTTSKEYVFNHGHKRLRLLTYGQDTVYRLDFGPDTDQPPYEIIVSDPLTALEWVRKGSLVTHRDFLRHCMATGKPFMTLSQSWQLQGPQDTVFTWYPPPSYRKAGWQPDTLDFRQYEARRKDFLLHAPVHAQLAPMGASFGD